MNRHLKIVKLFRARSAELGINLDKPPKDVQQMFDWHARGCKGPEDNPVYQGRNLCGYIECKCTRGFQCPRGPYFD